MGRLVKKSAAEMAEHWMKMHDKFFPEGKMTREEFAMEMMGIIDGKKFIAAVKDLVLDRQMERSRVGLAAYKQE